MLLVEVRDVIQFTVCCLCHTKYSSFIVFSLVFLKEHLRVVFGEQVFVRILVGSLEAILIQGVLYGLCVFAYG